MKTEDYKIRIVTDEDGSKEWYKDGKRHRDGDLPAIEWNNGTKFWYKDGVQYIPAEVKR